MAAGPLHTKHQASVRVIYATRRSALLKQLQVAISRECHSLPKVENNSTDRFVVLASLPPNRLGRK